MHHLLPDDKDSIKLLFNNTQLYRLLTTNGQCCHRKQPSLSAWLQQQPRLVKAPPFVKSNFLYLHRAWPTWPDDESHSHRRTRCAPQPHHLQSTSRAQPDSTNFESGIPGPTDACTGACCEPNRVMNPETAQLTIHLLTSGRWVPFNSTPSAQETKVHQKFYFSVHLLLNYSRP
jgi:hypothetical protein